MLSRAPIGLRKTGFVEDDKNCGTQSSNPLPSSSESVSALNSRAEAERPTLSREDRRVPEMRLIDSFAALAVDQTARSFRMISAARSPMMTQGAIVLPVVTFGMIEPSAMRSPSMP